MSFVRAADAPGGPETAALASPDVQGLIHGPCRPPRPSPAGWQASNVSAGMEGCQTTSALSIQQQMPVQLADDLEQAAGPPATADQPELVDKGQPAASRKRTRPTRPVGVEQMTDSDSEHEGGMQES